MIYEPQCFIFAKMYHHMYAKVGAQTIASGSSYVYVQMRFASKICISFLAYSVNHAATTIISLFGWREGAKIRR